MDFEEEEVELSSLPTQQQISEPYLLGFIIANIVGLKYYSGRINNRELVCLVREPLNQYDSNAIKVLNTRSAQVGHIERSVAAVLAPLLDSGVIILECIVPKPPKNHNPFRLPCQIHVFTSQELFLAVGTAIDEAGLSLITGNDHEFSMSESVAVKEIANENKMCVDDIFKNVFANGNEELVKIEANKDVVLTELFEHQKEGLGWLIARENSNDLPPFWEEKGGLFLNLLTNHETNERPEPIRGGIFADDMGLGKTLTLLSLIATNRNTSSSASTTLEACKGKKQSNVVKKVANPRKKQKMIDDMLFVSEEVVGPKTTLIVCPASVLSTWVDQLQQHTRRDSLKVYLYHGKRTTDVEELMSHDIVLTTFKTLGSEFGSANSPLVQIEWFRVIIDEAHTIKNFVAGQTKAVISLKAERRWAVTGTPIQNNPSDLFSLMAFLRFQPFSIKSYWMNLVQRPLDQGNKNGLSRLQALIGSISLRRMKEMPDGSQSLVGLPPKTLETCYIELSSEEREQYDQMESEAQNTVREYINSDTVLRNYSTVLHIILRLRQICNDISLCPPDVKSFLSSSTIEDVSKSPTLLKKLASMLEDGDDFDCPVCLSPPTKTVITRCTHIFCQTCILRTLKKLKSCCPICRSPLTQSDLYLAPPPKSPDPELFPSSSTERPISSKVSKLIQLLQASLKENPSTKSVVFSQFRKMLILLEEPLRAAGFSVVRLDGSMALRRRSEVMSKFGAAGPAAPQVLLASLKAAGTGINLTAASRVYLVDPWWNPAVEEQAMDRVHRIGQKEEVRVVRLIVKGSIEERILAMQEKKKKLAGGAFGRKADKEQRQMRVEEIRAMMRL